MGRELFSEILDVTRPAWDYPPAYWRALYVLAMWAEEDDQTIMTVEHLAELIGVSRQQASACLQKLKREGWIEVAEPAHGPASPNIYRVHIPTGWQTPNPGKWWERPLSDSAGN